MTDRRTAAGAPIDPTKNVLDLVDSAMQRQDDLRAAETERINQLAAQTLVFTRELASVLRANQDAASKLLADQLKEVKNDVSERVSKLEQFRWESGGKSQGVSATGAFVISTIGLIIAVGTLIVLVLKH